MEPVKALPCGCPNAVIAILAKRINQIGAAGDVQWPSKGVVFI